MMEGRIAIARATAPPTSIRRSVVNSYASPFEFIPPYNDPSRHRLSLPKPSLVVRTEISLVRLLPPTSIKSQVWKEERRRPHPPCVICRGSGKVDCRHCRGRGRTNYVHLSMLPKGEWPKWCKICRGSGVDYCSRCVGTGEYREQMGFRFKKMMSDQRSDCEQNP